MKNLGLSDNIARAVAECGYTTPTPIQQQVIPVILSGQDVIGSANTGTGKTAAYVLPLLHALSTQRREKTHASSVRALILVPTRELAIQVNESIQKYSAYLTLKSMAMMGGVGMGPQINQLRNRVDILVSTPGRLLDHVQQKTVNLSRVEMLVLDEADRMLDMGFIKDIKRILPCLPKYRQNLLFSATFSPEIKAMVKEFFDNPTTITAKHSETTAPLITHKVHPVNDNQKRALLEHLITEHNWYQVLVFTRTKHGANRLGEHLSDCGIPTGIIHGNKSQAARVRALDRFKKGSLQVLVATDVAGRGIDIADLPYVVNYELPFVPEDYVHRIGRTGRAGKEGNAISLVCVDEKKLQRDIERVIQVKLHEEVIPGFEPDPNIAPKPLKRGGGNSNNVGSKSNFRGRRNHSKR
jgi:ATP-dependent RNA helicase RhlE